MTKITQIVEACGESVHRSMKKNSFFQQVPAVQPPEDGATFQFHGGMAWGVSFRGE